VKRNSLSSKVSGLNLFANFSESDGSERFKVKIELIKKRKEEKIELCQKLKI
jgi:hypothetical protein